MTGSPETTVLVVTWRARDLLAQCLVALRGQTVPHRLLVVDNASTDGTAALLAGFPEARVLRPPRNLGYAGGVAAGLAAVDTEYVAVLNDDAVPSPDWLRALLDAAPGAAAVTSRMLLPDGPVNNAGVVLRPDGYGAFALRQVLRFPLTTASIALRRVRGRPVPPAPHFRARLRLRVLGSYLRLLPWALRSRRAIGRRCTVDRRQLLRDWAGVAQREP